MPVQSQQTEQMMWIVLISRIKLTITSTLYSLNPDHSNFKLVNLSTFTFIPTWSFILAL